MNTRTTLKTLFAIISILCFQSCQKDEESGEDNCSDKNIPTFVSSNEFLEVPNYTRRLTALSLKNEYCVITKDYIQYISKELKEETYLIPNLNIHEIQMNSIDTILHINNSFYRFSPASKSLAYIYGPPHSIHQFDLIPGHGIGYVGANTLAGPAEFNYFNYNTSSSQSIFVESEFIPDFSIEFNSRIFKVYLEKDSLHLLLSYSKKYIDRGFFYKINLERRKILQTKYYEGKNTLSILSRANNNFLKVKYENEPNGVYALENPFTNEQSWMCNYPNHYYGASNQASNDDYVCILDQDYPNPTIKLYDWSNKKMIWNIDVNNENIALGKIFLSPLGIVFYSSSSKAIEIFSYSDGCLLHKLESKNIVSEVLCSDEKTILIVNEHSKFEIFKIKN